MINDDERPIRIIKIGAKNLFRNSSKIGTEISVIFAVFLSFTKIKRKFSQASEMEPVKV